jgi:multidrug efflux system membrane fusion protein
MTMRRITLIAVGLLIGGGLGATIAWRMHSAAQNAERQRAEASQPIPVLVAAAARQDIPIYLDGLGTVQAYYTVTVHSMIDGPLIEVAFAEGQDVHVGDVLARIDPRPYQATLDQATAKKAQDEATLANARLDLTRYNKLAATAYTSAQTADTQRATVAQTEAIVRQDQAAIDSARTQLSYTTITAPIDGRTGIRQVDSGNIVHAADSNGIVVITTLRPISVLFTLPQQALPQVAAAMADGRAEVQALAQGDGASGKVLDSGTLEVLDNQVDPTTGTIKLKAKFPNHNLALWPGGFVNVRLKVRTEHSVITLPPVAVQRGPQSAYIYVVNTDQTVSRRDVTVGHEDLQASIITSGLDAGEEIVVDGASRLTDHAHVAVSAAPVLPIVAPGSVPTAGAPHPPGQRGAT